MIIKEWLESAKALYNLYDKISSYDFLEQKNNEDCQTILSLLSTAIRLERQKMENIAFTQQNITKMYQELSIYVDKTTCVYDLLKQIDNKSFMSTVRLFNSIDEIKELQVELPTSYETIFDYIEQMALYGEKLDYIYERYYTKYFSQNNLYILNVAKNNIDDSIIKERLTKLLYMSIFITPSYKIFI